MRRLWFVSFSAIIACLAAGCAQRVQYWPNADAVSGDGRTTAFGPTFVDVSDLEREIRAITRKSAERQDAETVASEPRGAVASPPSVEQTPPPLASDHPDFKGGD